MEALAHVVRWFPELSLSDFPASWTPERQGPSTHRCSVSVVEGTPVLRMSKQIWICGISISIYISIYRSIYPPSTHLSLFLYIYTHKQLACSTPDVI